MNIIWDYEGESRKIGEPLTQVLTQPKKKENPGSSTKLWFLWSILHYASGKKGKLFFRKRERATQTHMYGEILVEHLSKIKRCYQQIKILLFASHQSYNQKNNLIWDFESKTRSKGKPWTGVTTSYHVPKKKEKCRKLKQTATYEWRKGNLFYFQKEPCTCSCMVKY